VNETARDLIAQALFVGFAAMVFVSVANAAMREVTLSRHHRRPRPVRDYPSTTVTVLTPGPGVYDWDTDDALGWGTRHAAEESALVLRGEAPTPAID
jgi:hypothetical protein